MPLLQHNNSRAMPASDRPPGILPVTPVPTAEATLAEAEMELSVGRVLDDHLAGRLESVANDTSLPRAIRARAMIVLCRFR